MKFSTLSCQILHFPKTTEILKCLFLIYSLYSSRSKIHYQVCFVLFALESKTPAISEEVIKSDVARGNYKMKFSSLSCQIFFQKKKPKFWNVCF